MDLLLLGFKYTYRTVIFHYPHEFKQFMRFSKFGCRYTYRTVLFHLGSEFKHSMDFLELKITVLIGDPHSRTAPAPTTRSFRALSSFDIDLTGHDDNEKQRGWPLAFRTVFTRFAGFGFTLVEIGNFRTICTC